MQLVLLQQQRHRVFDAHVTHEDRGFHVRTQVFVEDEIQPRDLRQHFENGLEVGVAKFQGHRPVELGAQLRIGNHIAALHQTNVALQLQRPLVGRVEFEDLFDLAVGAVDVAATQVTPGQFELLVHAAQVFELTQRILGAPVVRLDGQHAAVSRAGRNEIAA